MALPQRESVSAFSKKTRKTPPARSTSQSVASPIGAGARVVSNPCDGGWRKEARTTARMDDLDQLNDDLAEDDPAVKLRVAAAGATGGGAATGRTASRGGTDPARASQRMGTSQGQITRFESGADTHTVDCRRLRRCGWG
jgi:hypothetical protein